MSDDEEDPLDHLVDDIDDEQDAPSFGDVGGPDAGEQPSTDSDPATRTGAEHDQSTAQQQSDATGSRSGPLGDLAADLDERSEPTPADDELFDEESVADIDPETVWEQVEADTDEEAGTVPPIDADERVERVVDTGSYCEGCEFFSAPPDVHCTHDGTEIIEMVDIDHFRVVDCPIVAEDERLERL